MRLRWHQTKMILMWGIIIGLFAHTALAFCEEEKPTILILSSKGGGGHISAAHSLEQLIGDKYHLKVVYPIDQLKIWGIPSGEQFYNTMLRRGWIRSMNFIVRHVAPSIFRSRMGKLERIIASHIKTHRPDLVISLIPFINCPAAEAARKQEIPYLVITVDNDLKNWAFGLEGLQHPDFKITIGLDLPTTRGLLLQKNITDDQIETIGLPLRAGFAPRQDVMHIFERLQIPHGKPVILIMMGGAGGNTAYDYAKRIGQMDIGAHLLVVAGRNVSLKEEMEELEIHPSNSLSAFGYVEEVADLMAVSDLIITKPGPGTINEAMVMQLPILVDNVGISLFWERANVDVVLNYGVGERIRNYKQLKGLLKLYLYDAEKKEMIKDSFISVPPNRFQARIPSLIKEMIEAKRNKGSVVHSDESSSLISFPETL